MFGRDVELLEGLRGDLSDRAITILKDLFGNDAKPLEHEGPLTLNLTTPPNPAAENTAALNIWGTGEGDPILVDGDPLIDHITFKPAISFVLTSTLTDNLTATATITQEHGPGLTHGTGDVTIINQGISNGRMQFAGEIGAVGRAMWDKDRQFICLYVDESIVGTTQ